MLSDPKQSVAKLSTKYQISPAPAAFTIVELLVVIVVIGVLAAITIVSYTGITNKAILASLQSDLANASKQLSIFNVDYGYYPNTINCAIADGPTNKCIRTSSDNDFTYNPGAGLAPQAYVLSANRGVVSYVVTNNSKIIQIAPLNPLADWLATPLGDHYGNYYDLAGRAFASVTRAGTKTIYDSTTQKTYDVPANYLAIRPRSDGKGGSEAVIEEARTNQIQNSKLIDTNGDSKPDLWPSSAPPSSISYAIEQDENDNRMHVIFDNDNTNWVYEQTVINSPAIGATYTYSGEIETRNISAGTYPSIEVYCVGGSTPYFAAAAPIGGTSAKNRYSVSFTVPSGTTAIRTRFRRVSGNPISGNVWFSRPQIELGGFATSYVRTVDASPVTRNADVVTVPTISTFNKGSVFAVIAQPPTGITSGRGIYTFGYNGSNEILFYAASTSVIQAGFNSGGVYSYGQSKGTLTTYNTGVWRWSSNGSQQTLNGVHGALNSALLTTGVPTTTYIGSYYGGSQNYSSPIQRIVVYGDTLSDSDVTSVTNAIKDGM